MMYHFHDYSLDPASREVWHGTHRLALEPKVFHVLLYLLEHRDRMVPKAELLEQCWPETFVSESALTKVSPGCVKPSSLHPRRRRSSQRGTGRAIGLSRTSGYSRRVRRLHPSSRA